MSTQRFQEGLLHSYCSVAEPRSHDAEGRNPDTEATHCMIAVTGNVQRLADHRDKMQISFLQGPGKVGIGTDCLVGFLLWMMELF